MVIKRTGDHHKRFQYLIAFLFFAASMVVGIWMVWGPEPEGAQAKTAQFFFIEMPLFVILALVGMNALVRAGMGSRKR